MTKKTINNKTKRKVVREIETTKTLRRTDLQNLAGGTIVVTTDPSTGSISFHQGIRKGGR